MEQLTIAEQELGSHPYQICNLRVSDRRSEAEFHDGHILAAIDEPRVESRSTDRLAPQSSNVTSPREPWSRFP